MIVKVYRGTHEFGGSCVSVRTKKTSILLDVGSSLAGKDFEVPKRHFDAILFSHAHKDHYGEINSFKNIKIYSGENTKILIDITCDFTGKAASTNPWYFFEDKTSFMIGDIKVTPFLIDHSSYDSYMLLLEAENKKLIYTGDFRLNGRKGHFSKHQIKKMPKNIDLLICEGTTLTREDSPVSENQIEKEFAVIFKEKSPILINVSAQNIDRIVSITRACIKTKKKFIIDPYTAYVLDKLNSKNLPNVLFDCIHIFYPRYLSEKIAKIDKAILYRYRHKKIEIKAIKEQLNNIVMLVRPSMLYDLKNRIKNLQNAIFIHSMWKGYWDDSTLDKFKNFIKEQGMRLNFVHTSGHACKKEILFLLEELKPKMVLPIHTENPAMFKSFYQNIILLNDKEEYFL